MSFFFSDSKFKKSDAFIGFQKDTPASVVFQATNLLRSATQAGCDVIVGQCADVLEWSQWKPEEQMEEDRNEAAWGESVSVGTKIYTHFLERFFGCRLRMKRVCIRSASIMGDKIVMVCSI